MSFKNKKIIIFIASLVVFVVGYVFSNMHQFNIFCESGSFSCYQNFDSIGIPIFYASIPLLIISSILLFIKEGVFNKWQKFAIWYLPIATALIILIPEPGSGDFLAPSNIMFTKWFFWFYALVSLILIIYKSVMLKKNK